MVVVEKSYPAAGSFEQILVLVFASEDGFDIESCLFGHIDELHAERCAADWRRDTFRRRTGLGFVALPCTPLGFRLRFGRRLLHAECRPRQCQHVLE
jgi:hypothetical protein